MKKKNFEEVIFFVSDFQGQQFDGLSDFYNASRWRHFFGGGGGDIYVAKSLDSGSNEGQKPKSSQFSLFQNTHKERRIKLRETAREIMFDPLESSEKEKR